LFVNSIFTLIHNYQQLLIQLANQQIMGVLIAFTIIISWLSHLIYILLYQPVDLGNGWFGIHILIQTWLFTGLFITAHDAMHGTVSKNKKLNDAIGFLSAFLFAGLFYGRLNGKHKLHHLYPGTRRDPDYKTGNQQFFAWWFSFMKQYISIWQLIVMALLFNILLIWFNEMQLIALWIIPSILATFQLFFFGTFQPHHLPHTPQMHPYNARSQKRNHLYAMLTCYFFGYHYEHHASPETPWWKLYQIKS